MKVNPRSPASNSNPVRFGIIGIGNMGVYHARLLATGKVAGASLAAVCDTEPERTREFAPVAAVFASAEELFQSGLVDAVLIATPHYSHVPIGISALKSGLHVLIEKPLAVDKESALRLLGTPRKKTQKFGVVFNQRTDPHYSKVRELVRNGTLGEVRRVQWTVTDWFRTHAYYRSSDWRATWAGEGGGVLLNQAVHNLDLFQWIFGMPVEVRAVCDLGKYHPIEVEDDVTALFRLSNGANATFTTSTGEAPGTNRMEIAGENGRLVLENGRLEFLQNETPSSDFSKTSPEGYNKPPIRLVEIPLPLDRGDQHLGILQNFANAILTNTPLAAEASEGLKSVELINAILWSSLEDKTIHLPISAEGYSRLLNRLKKQSKKSSLPVVDRSGWKQSHHFGTTSAAG